MIRTIQICTSMAVLLGLVACDYSGDWLFEGAIEGIPGIYHLEAEDGGPLVPASINSLEDVDAATIYAEVGPPGTSEEGGVTFTFDGTGGHVCVWVDPELVYWNQSVAATGANRNFSYPDNVFDDGDIDLYAGYSVFYTGSPGERIGDFEVSYEDSLENDIPISLSECLIRGRENIPNAHSGRGAPEYCTLFNTVEGIGYTVLLQTFSTPLDDDRLSFGLLLVDGTCEGLLNTLPIPGGIESEECVIRGEAIQASDDHGPWYNINQAPTWAGSEVFENAFCSTSIKMSDFCEEEAEAIDDAGIECDWDDVLNVDAHCFCGDPANNPTG